LSSSETGTLLLDGLDEARLLAGSTLPELLARLEQALAHQLLGQYMVDRRAQHGVLLRVYQGKKQHWVKGGRTSFAQVVGHLAKSSRELSAAQGRELRVVGIDATCPTGRSDTPFSARLVR